MKTPEGSVNTRLASYTDEDYFGAQPTSSKDLPDPRELCENLALSVIEVIAGARDLEQVARWLTDDVHRMLLKRVNVAIRARSLKKLPTHRPAISVGRCLLSEPHDGIVEAVVIIHGKARTRSVAIRLEGRDGRWRASALHIL